MNVCAVCLQKLLPYLLSYWICYYSVSYQTFPESVGRAFLPQRLSLYRGTANIKVLQNFKQRILRYHEHWVSICVTFENNLLLSCILNCVLRQWVTRKRQGDLPKLLNLCGKERSLLQRPLVSVYKTSLGSYTGANNTSNATRRAVYMSTHHVHLISILLIFLRSF
jgi:hypothetical protein